MDTIITLAYLVAASLFILGLKRLGSPATARSGNQLSAFGMLVAIVATLFLQEILTPVEMILGLVIGSGIGVVLARRVEMTSMPELVAVFNAFGGGASAFVAGAEIAKMQQASLELASVVPVQTGGGGEPLTAFLAVTIGLSILIGTVTFSGSFVAFGKLNGKISGQPIAFPGMRLFTTLVALGVIGGIVWMLLSLDAFPVDSDPVIWAAVGIAVLAFVLGILLVIPIGGADMPVVVALLNSYSGLAAAATGFVLANYALIVSGALVGASGLILTKIMCEAMNRSLANVLLGGFGVDGDAVAALDSGSSEGKTVKEIAADDAAILLSYAQKIAIVPGYGMAVAQAQHAARELADELQKKGVEVHYGIHPVAGRMPGHMNVLLAEANVPYDLLLDMDEINPNLETTDVVLVVGANDVVNPAARTNTASPIYGMPILNVDKAQNVIVLKRSLRPGYAGVENELFFNPRTSMLFGDAKDSLSKLTQEVKEL